MLFISISKTTLHFMTNSRTASFGNFFWSKCSWQRMCFSLCKLSAKCHWERKLTFTHLSQFCFMIKIFFVVGSFQLCCDRLPSTFHLMFLVHFKFFCDKMLQSENFPLQNNKQPSNTAPTDCSSRNALRKIWKLTKCRKKWYKMASI